MLTRSRKRMNVILTLMAAVPITIFAIFGIFFPNRVQIGILIALIFLFLALIAFFEARKTHNKIVNQIKAYQDGLEDYIEKTVASAKEERRARFIKENNKHNAMDDLYFGKDQNRDNDYMKKEESNLAIFGNYIHSMNNNVFLMKLKSYASQKNMKLETVAYKAQVSKEVLDKLNDPAYRIPRNIAIRFALALELTFDEANDLLASAYYRLDKEREYDAAISFFFENKLYNIDFINLSLLTIKYEEI